MVDIFYWGFNIWTEDVDYLLPYIIDLFLNKRRMKTCIYHQVLQCVWSGRNCGRTYHDFVWIICYLCINYLFYTLQHQDLFSILETKLDSWYILLGVQHMHWWCWLSIHFYHWIFLNIRRMKTCIYRQVIQCVWIGGNFGRIYHYFV